MVGLYGMSAKITNTNPLYVAENSPAAETSYHARFYFNPNSVTMSNGKAHQIFQALMANNTVVLRVEFGVGGVGYRIRTVTNSNTGTTTSSSWVPITNAAHYIELYWQAGTASTTGSLTLWVDGVNVSTLTGLTNNLLTIDQVRLGVIAGVDNGTLGTELFDAFESRRYSYIGP